MRKKILILAIVFTCLSVSSIRPSNVSEAAEPYIFGYLSDMTGPGKTLIASEAEGFGLYMEHLNAQGGINGHPIKVIVGDGKSEPDRSAMVAKKMIEQDKVLAILGLGFSPSQPPVHEIAKKSGIPIVTGFTATEKIWNTKPGDIAFGIGYTMHPQCHIGGYTAAQVMKRLYPEGSRIALLGMTTPGSRIWIAWTSEWLTKMGYKVVLEDFIPPEVPNISPWVMKVVNNTPDAVYTSLPQVFPIAANLEKLGWTKDIFYVDFLTEAEAVVGMKRLVGSGEWMVQSGRITSSYEDLPEMKKIRETIKKYGYNYTLSSGHFIGWTMGRLIEQALSRTGWPCNHADLIAALEKTDLDTRGLYGGPIRFTPTDHYGSSWWKASRWSAARKGFVPAIDWIRVEAREIEKK